MKRGLLLVLPLAAIGIWMLWHSAASTESGELATALRQYTKSVGVLPNEFLQLSAVHQESYLRGVLDGEYYLAELNKAPFLDGFVDCLNAKHKTILSEAKVFLERENEQEYLVPWTLSVLIGQNCPKESRVSAKESPVYTEATTYLKLTSISKKGSDKAYTEEEGKEIRQLFIRGVLDGTVFGLYGHNASDLVEYLKCLSKPGSLEKISEIVQISQYLGKDWDRSQAYAVAEGISHACKPENEAKAEKE